MVKFFVVIIVLMTKQTRCWSSCSQHEYPTTNTGYHLTKECAESKMRIVGTSDAEDFESCVKLANAKNAFALAYANHTEDFNNTLSSTCKVFECPEFHQFLMTTSVSAYNYYSMFSKPLPNENFTCAPGIGVFEVVADRLNYSNAMIACEDGGGHLADVVSDARTSFLSALVSSTLSNRTTAFRKAFVGLFFENDFVTLTGEPLSCLPFRAWAPGHPKARKLKKDCVVLTSDRHWQTEDCSTKLPYICELVPDGPMTPVERYCAPIGNIKRRKNCILRNHKQFEQMEQTEQQCFNIKTNESEAKNYNN